MTIGASVNKTEERNAGGRERVSCEPCRVRTVDNWFISLLRIEQFTDVLAGNGE